MTSEETRGLLREPGDGAADVRPVELFFDLVYVLAVTQLTSHLVSHLTFGGAGETALLLLTVWAGWNYTSWVTNYFDPDTRAVRLMLLGAMLASLVMSSSLPTAFGPDGLRFAIALVTLQIGRTVFALVMLERRHQLTPIFWRALIWWSATGVMWLAGAIAHNDLRAVIWTAAVIVDYGGVWLGNPVPRMGRSLTGDYTITGSHMAERCEGFVILALGESIIITGLNFGQLPSSAGRVAAFAIAFVSSVALWWIYFDRSAEAARGVISDATDPGRLGVSAYTYCHLPIVAGIIVAAAADKLTIAHPDAGVTAATAAVILGGPALYLLGNALFKWALWRELPRSRPLAILTLSVLVLLALVSSLVILLFAATVIVVGVALLDARNERSSSNEQATGPQASTGSGERHAHHI
jgi:low temperature requirement protein LtrA